MIRNRISCGCLALALAQVAGAIPATAAPSITIAGGTLDPAHPGADVYLGTPASAKAPPGAACRLAHDYVERVNAGDAAGTARLFADDAVILEPIRRTIGGRAQVDAFYAERLAQMKPQLIAVSYLGHERECMVALANRTEIGGEQRYVLVSIDHFILGKDGKAQSMVAFARPPRQ